MKKFNICTIKQNEEDVFETISSIKLLNTLRISNERTENIKKETAKDITLQKLIKMIVDGYIKEVADEIKTYFKYKHELTAQNGPVFRNDKILIPYSLRRLTN